MSPELLQVLEAREARWQRRLALAQGRGRTLVTVTLCLPVAYRTAPEFLTLAEGLFARLEGLFLAQEIPCRREEPLNGADGPALFHNKAGMNRKLCRGVLLRGQLSFMFPGCHKVGVCSVCGLAVRGYPRPEDRKSVV